MDGEKEKGWRRMVEEEEIGHGGSLRMDGKKGVDREEVEGNDGGRKESVGHNRTKEESFFHLT